jgi:spore coat polysaccharide biosynthesis predicted glycosyltransferase SpsG
MQSKARQMNRKNAKCLTHVAVYPDGCCPESGKPRIWIRTAAGPSIGFGHLRRSVTLARLLEKKTEPVFLSDPQDEWTQSECAVSGWCCREFRPDCLQSDELPGIVLVDTREPHGLDNLVGEARDLRMPVASIHDLGLNPIDSDIVIDGSVRPVRGGKPGAMNYLGTEYLVLDPMYAEVHRRPRPLSAEIRSVFINLGGGDARRFFPAVLKGLRSWDPEVTIVAARGFGNWGQDLAGIRWADRGEKVWDLFFQADAAITAGGLSCCEALCCGTPLLAMSYDSCQHSTVSTLAKEELCVDLGLGDSLQAPRIPPLMETLAGDPVGKEKRSAAGKRRVDGRGAERVRRILEECIARIAA